MNDELKRIEADERAVPVATVVVRDEGGFPYIERMDHDLLPGTIQLFTHPPAQADAASKEQWDELAAILDADGDNVDDVFSQAKALVEAANRVAPAHPHSPDAADSGRGTDGLRKAIEQIKWFSTVHLRAGTAATDGLFNLSVAHGANETAAAVLAHDANGEMNELQSCVYNMAALAALTEKGNG